MLSFTINWCYEKLVNIVKPFAMRHSNKIITIFFLYNYYLAIIDDFCKRYNIHLRKSTKLVVPTDPNYFSKFFYYTMVSADSADSANTKDKVKQEYYLYYETNTDMYMPISNSDNTTVHMYTTPDHILCYLTDREMPEKDQITKSRAKFINIVYSNPVINNPLTLRLDHRYMTTENEILNASHVLYLLRTEYENTEYVFDLTYEIKIVDSNLNVIVIKSDQWLQLTDVRPGYTIKTNSNE